jgi:phosphonate degradation associated HDIG domain protein
MLEDIKSYLEVAGQSLYDGEAISQLEHAKQCAMHAEIKGSTPALIAASLLHDIGHLVDKKFQMGQENEIDRYHETIGAGFLSKAFPPSVTEPIRMHVLAKRYLCAVEDGYFDCLSSASVRSLSLQGGVFTAKEAEDFMTQPFAEDAVNLRQWDELAKVLDCVTPSLDHFMEYVGETYISSAA